MSQFRIMFVCLGNICRSPVAQAVLEDLIRKEGLEDRILVESSGMDAYHIGQQSDSRMRRTASSHGIRINHHSQRMNAKDCSEYDLILAMDQHNYRDLLTLCRSDEEAGKVRMFRDFDPKGSGDVPDPWYGGDDGFEEVWDIVSRTCGSILSTVLDRTAF